MHGCMQSFCSDEFANSRRNTITKPGHLFFVNLILMYDAASIKKSPAYINVYY
jgi:hypothetical protein